MFSYISDIGEQFSATILPPGTKAENIEGFLEAIATDEKDPYYANLENKLDDLNDVSYIDEQFPTLVVRWSNTDKFFGKISMSKDDELKAIRVIYLYVAGDRRRLRQANGCSTIGERSTFIMWKLCLLVAKDIYGESGCVYVMFPRTSVLPALLAFGAEFFKTANLSDIRYMDLISTPILDERTESTDGAARIHSA